MLKGVHVSVDMHSLVDVQRTQKGQKQTPPPKAKHPQGVQVYAGLSW